MINLMSLYCEVTSKKCKRYDKQHLIDRIEWLLILQFFLFLRQKIKTEVQQNYLTGVYNVIIYDQYDCIEYDYMYISKASLEPLINDYIKFCEKQITKDNYKLEL